MELSTNLCTVWVNPKQQKKKKKAKNFPLLPTLGFMSAITWLMSALGGSESRLYVKKSMNAEAYCTGGA